MPPPAIHQHLRLLEESGVVVTAKTGRVRTCRLDPKVLRRAEDWFARRRHDVGAPSRCAGRPPMASAEEDESPRDRRRQSSIAW